MGRSAIPVTALTRTGVQAAAAIVADATLKHLLVSNDGRTFLEIVSTDAGAQFVDVQIPQTVDGQAITSKRINVPAGTRVKAGPYPMNIYNQAAAAAATQVLTSDGTAPSSGETVTVGATTYTFRTALTEAKATATLTSDATSPTDGDTVTVDTHVYTFKTALTEAKATGTLTSTGTSPADGDTVTVDTHVYTFKTALTGAADQVLINGSAANALANLKKAINLTGVAGTDYGTGTLAHTTVDAGTLTATTLVLTAKTLGTGGNSIATTEVSAQLSFGAATLTGGVNAIADQVLINGSAANALANLKKAINLTGVAGTDYSTGTSAHTTVDAGTLTATTLVLTAKTLGTGGNSFNSFEVSTHLSFGGATFSGGVNAIANEVLIGGSVANALAHLASAINDSGAEGTDYSTGTATNTSASAVAAPTTVTVTALTAGAAGNTTATTETSAHLSFAAATLTGGYDPGAGVLIDPSVSTTLSLFAFTS